VSGGGLTDFSDHRRREPSEFWTETEVYRCTAKDVMPNLALIQRRRCLLFLIAV
jgi:hypothetical protein